MILISLPKNGVTSFDPWVSYFFTGSSWKVLLLTCIRLGKVPEKLIFFPIFWRYFRKIGTYKLTSFGCFNREELCNFLISKLFLSKTQKIQKRILLFVSAPISLERFQTDVYKSSKKQDSQFIITKNIYSICQIIFFIFLCKLKLKRNLCKFKGLIFMNYLRKIKIFCNRA